MDIKSCESSETVLQMAGESSYPQSASAATEVHKFTRKDSQNFCKTSIDAKMHLLNKKECLKPLATTTFLDGFQRVAKSAIF